MKEIKTLHSISYFTGKPAVGIAKAQGVLKIYDDRLVFNKILGNAIGNSFGVVGMLIARSKTLKEGKTNTYMYSDIRTVSPARYMGTMPMVTIEMSNGELHSFTGLLFKPDEVSNMIDQYRSKTIPNGREQTLPQSGLAREAGEAAASNSTDTTATFSFAEFGKRIS